MKNLIKKMLEQDVYIWVEGDKLKLRATDDFFQTELASQIRQHKPSLIQFLTHHEIVSEEISIQNTHALTGESKQVKANRNAGIDGIYPANSLQQGFIYHHLHYPNDDAYRIQTLLDVYHELDIPAYQQAWSLASLRYPVLRTAFNWDGEMVQVITRDASIDECHFTLKDISHLSECDRDQAIETIQKNDRMVSFDLTKPGLIRFTLIKHHDHHYTILRTDHHSISDGWSGPILLQTVHAYYMALLKDETPVVEAETAYPAAQAYLAKNRQQTNAYWQQVKSQFGDVNDINALLSESVDLSQTRVIDTPAEQSIAIEGIAYARLKQRCRELGVTVNAVAQFAWHKLLHTYTQDEQTIVGTTVSGRDIPVEGIESSVGLYINTLPLAVHWDGEATIQTMLERIQQGVSQLNHHSGVSLATLQQQGERLFHSLFVFENYPVKANDAAHTGSDSGVKIRFRNAIEKVDYPLSVMAFEQDETLQIKLSYGQAWLNDEQANRLLAQMEMIVRSVIADPKVLHQQISLVADDERHLLLQTWNQTDAPYPQDSTFHQLFEAQVEQTPDNIALMFGGETLTYRELNHRANQLARIIQSQYRLQDNQTLQPDTLIALYLDRSLEMIISILAVLKAGGAYVPISPEYPQERTQFILRDTQAQLLLTQKSHGSRLDTQLRTSGSAAVILTVDQPSTIKSTVNDNLDVIVGSTNLAYVIYTSGTTGQPKGVMIEHQSLLSYASGFLSKMDNQLGNVDFSTNYCFDLSVTTMLCPLLVGNCVCIYSGEISDIVSYQQHLKSSQINLIKTTPSIAQLVLPGADHAIETLVLGGEKLASASVKLLSQYARQIIDEYGPTETTVGALYSCVSPSIDKGIGKAYPNTKLYVLDEEGNVLPTGASGELFIGGAGLARGYFNRPDLTAERFIENPFATEADRGKGYTSLYKTGDVVRWLADGNLEYLGRNDSQVKIRGYRIELGEIESVIASQQGIKQAVVIDRERQGNQYLLAYFVAEPGVTVDLDVLRGSLETSQLPEYMIPSNIAVIDEVPLTANGKLDRNALPEQDVTNIDTYVAPRTELESQLCAIWQEVLGLDQVGIYDNFFRIGGNSITAIRLTAVSRQSIDVDIPLALLFEHKTVAGLAKVLGAGEMLVIPQHQQSEQPLSFAQERLLFIERFEQGTDAYHIPVLVRLDDHANIDALAQAIEVVVGRHPVLNSVYRTNDTGANYQQQLSNSIVMHSHTLANEVVLAEAVQAIVAPPFDLENDAPMRVHHYDQGESQYLLIVWHHIAFDGWSTEVFLRELSQAYVALNDGLPPELPELSINYGDYAVWQRDYLQNEQLASLLDYWTNQLSDLDTLDLPLDSPRPAQIDFQGKDHDFVLDAALSKQLRDFSQGQETTLYTVMLSAFYVTLAALSGQDDIVVGTPSDNRHHAQTQSLIGFFVNSLVLRSRVNTRLSVSDYIAQVHQLVSDAKVHQELPFERLVDALGLERDTSRHPLFQVMFSVQSFASQEIEESALAFTPVALSEQGGSPAKHDLSLFIDDAQEQLSLNLNYAVNLFKPESMCRLAAMYQRVLTAMVTNQQQALSAIELISEQERDTLLQTWNQTDAAYPKDQTIHQLFEAQVEKTPDHVAMMFEGESLTYRELNQRANQLAHAIRDQYQTLHNQVLLPDTRIALYLDRSLEMVISLLAVFKAGGAYVPISPEYPAERTQYLLEDSQAQMILTQSHHLPVLDKILTAVSQPPSALLVDEAGARQKYAATNPDVDMSSTDLAYVIYTSGTTGQPKGVMVEHQSVANLITGQTESYAFDQTDVAIWISNYTFDASLEPLLLTLLNGAKIVIPSAEALTQIDEIKAQIIDHKVTHIDATPSYLMAVGEIKPKDHIKRVISGGEACAPALHQIWGGSLINAYGPTEATVTATNRTGISDQLLPNNIGQPVRNTQLYVLQSDARLAPMGTPGELFIGGAGLARGYLNQPDLTAERFIDNPFATKEDKEKGYTRLYKTGDIVRWLPGGNLEYLGRNDNQVKIRGFRIELGEIESALQVLDGVKQAVVIDCERDGHRSLASYVVFETKENNNTDALRKALASQLPDYMVPVSFTVIDEVPLTINGKLDRKALPEPILMSTESYAAPRTDLESRLCEIWQAVLGLEQVGIHDNFFRIGGDSIVSLQLVSRMRQELLNVQVKDIFEAPTVAQLAAKQSNSTAKVMLDAEQGLLAGEFELLPIQKWFFEQDFEEPNHWNQSFAVRIPSEINVSDIESALHALAEQHDMLRAGFENKNGVVCQRYLESHHGVMAPVHHFNISGNADDTALLEEMTQWQRGFDIEQGPLWRAAHVTGFEDGSARLLFAFHHLIIDAVSWRIIAEDMALLLTGHTLSQKTSSYRQWVDVVSSYSQSHPDEHRYWNEVMSGQAIRTELSPPQFNTLSLSAEMTETLLRTANQGYHTEINDVLLSALSLALQATFERDVNHISLEGHGREELDESIDISRTVGWFTTQYPVLLTSKPSLKETLVHTKEMLRAIPNKGIGYGACIDIDDGDTTAILPAISFNYLGQFGNTAQADDELWQLTAEPTGEQISANNKDALSLNINGGVYQGRLGFNITSQLSSPLTERFYSAFERSLNEVIEHCFDVAQAGGVKTPSDYPGAQLTFSQLETLQERYRIAGLYAAGSLQQEFIRHHQHNPNDDAYQVQLRLEVDHELDISAYQQAWALTSLRYPALRTALNWDGGMVQVITQDASIDDRHFIFKDISHVVDSDREQAIETIQRQDRTNGFDLTLPGLIRFILIRHSDCNYTIVINYHQSVSDSRSAPILLKTVHAYYQALIKGEAPEVKPEEAYSAAQSYLANKHKQTNAYWQQAKTQFGEANDINALLSKPVELSQTRTVDTPARQSLVIEEGSYEQLQLGCRELGVTVNVAAQFAWHKLLHTYTKNAQTIVGTVVSGRTIPVDGVESSVGLYTNILPAAVDWTSETSTLMKLEQIQHSITDLNNYSGGILSAIERHEQPLFHSLYLFGNDLSPDGNETNEINGENIGIHLAQTIVRYPYPLVIRVNERDDCLELQLNYDSALLSDESAGLLLKQMQHMITYLHDVEEGEKHPVSLNNYWVFKRPNYNHWNVSNLFILPHNSTQELIYQAARAVVSHHSGLRRIWHNEGKTWQTSYVAIDDLAPWWIYHDLQGCDANTQKASIEMTCQQLQLELDVTNDLFKIVYFDLGEHEQPRLFLLFHHMLVDAYSMTILLEDFIIALKQMSNNQHISLPVTTSTIAEFTQKQLSQTEVALEQQLSAWLDYPWHQCFDLKDQKLITDWPKEKQTTVAHVVQHRFDKVLITKLERLARETEVTVDVLMITAIRQAYEIWTKGKTAFICRAQNGRYMQGLNLRRTVGWIASYHVTFFDTMKTSNWKDAIIDTAKRVSDSADESLLYQHTRFINTDPKVTEVFSKVPEPNLEFNYIPSFASDNEDVVNANILEVSTENTGEEESQYSLVFPLYGQAGYVNDICELKWSYSPAMHNETQMEDFLALQIAALQSMVIK